MTAEPTMVTPFGTRRRIRALARLGWSRRELATRLSVPLEYLESVFVYDEVEEALASAVAGLFERLSMTLSTAPDASRTAAAARHARWPAPLAWDDDAIDDPAGLSCGAVAGERELDESAVVRVNSGDWSLSRRLTPPERAEVCRRWYGQGRSLAQLEALTGWKTDRYYRVNDQEVA